jgi:hypothetical protein
MAFRNNSMEHIKVSGASGRSSGVKRDVKESDVREDMPSEGHVRPDTEGVGPKQLLRIESATPETSTTEPLAHTPIVELEEVLSRRL